jgi:uncharacterized protein involved in exopolysaccharide biosynthesis
MHEKFVLNIPFVIDLIQKWKRKILLFLAVLFIVSTLLLILTPNLYYSYTSAISTNSQLNDKSSIYNPNLDELHNSLGNWADLDRIYSTCELDTSYKFLIRTFNLTDHYKINLSDSNKAVQQALHLLKTETMKMEKTETGLLRIHVWDKDPVIAANMANKFIQFIENLNRNLQEQYNRNIIDKININIKEKSIEFKDIEAANSSAKTPADIQLLQIKKNAILEEINQQEKILNQYKLVLKAQQPSLIVIDKATPNYKHDSPKRIMTLVTIMICGLVFCIFLITVLESLKLYSTQNESNRI